MSFIIKGFCTINTLLDGKMGNIAPLGELSAYSRTFSTVKTNIASPDYDDISIDVFSCKEDGVIKDMPTDTDTYLLGLLDDLIKHFTVTLPFEDQFATRYPEAVLLEVDEMITAPEGLQLPGYIRFSTNVAEEPVEYVIWFSDAVFRTTYDEYEIRVVPPLPNPSDMETDHATFLQRLDDYEFSERIAQIELARNNDPATKIATLKLRWTEPNTSFSMEVDWTLVTFGPMGLLYENQLQAIRDYLFDTTGKTSDQWAIYFPDLITQATLFIIPLWDHVALRSSGSLEYVHSPVIGPTDMTEGLTKCYGRAPTEQEMAKTIYATILYKSIGFLAFQDEHSGSSGHFSALYPDYAMIPLNDININRLTLSTRDAIAAIEKGIRLAEVDDGTQTLPVSHSRIEVDGKMYLQYTTHGVIHRVMTKGAYLS